MRRIQAILIASLAFLAVPAKAAGLPPIGKRTYVIDQSAPHAPVKIEKESAKATVYLKDPVHPNGPIKLEPIKTVARKKTVVAHQAAPAVRTGSMRFGKLGVSGHVKRPRVEFTREVLSVDRADEPVAPEFFQKVFEPAQDQDF